MHAYSFYCVALCMHCRPMSELDLLVNKNHCAWVVRFSAAIPKDKSNQLMNALTLKTAQMSSLSSLSPNLRTTQRALVAEKCNTEKERLQR